MSSTPDSQRIDLLLALALIFAEGEAREDEEVSDGDEASVEEGGEGARRLEGALELLSGIGASGRLAVERRAEWFARLAPEKQHGWLAHMLGRARARERLAQLDEHVHPSHVVEALMQEPPHIQTLIIRHLPPALAVQTAKALGVALPAPDDSRPNMQATGDDGSSPGSFRVEQSRVTTAEAVAHEGHAAADGGVSSLAEATPAPEVISVVRRAFLSHFVSAGELTRPTPLDLLPGIELARLIRLLGVRETALACRGIAAKEAVASFLRRFAAEDARAIATHIATLTSVEPQRIAFAEEIVREAIGGETEPGTMLDRAGLHLLAIALAGRDESQLRYTAQKLPLETARWLRETVEKTAATPPATHGDGDHMRDMVRLVARETETLAAGMRRRNAPRPGAHAARQNADASRQPPGRRATE